MVTPLLTRTLRLEDVVFAGSPQRTRTAYSLLPSSAHLLIAVRTRTNSASSASASLYLLVEVFAQIMMLVGRFGKIAMYLPGQMAAALSNLNSEIMAVGLDHQRAGEVLALIPNTCPSVPSSAWQVIAFLRLAARIFLSRTVPPSGARPDPHGRIGSYPSPPRMETERA